MAEEQSGFSGRGMKRRFAKPPAGGAQQLMDRGAHGAEDSGFIVASIGRRQGQAMARRGGEEVAVLRHLEEKCVA